MTLVPAADLNQVDRYLDGSPLQDIFGVDHGLDAAGDAKACGYDHIICRDDLTFSSFSV